MTEMPKRVDEQKLRLFFTINCILLLVLIVEGTSMMTVCQDYSKYRTPNAY